jgi:hypothetical protein
MNSRSIYAIIIFLDDKDSLIVTVRDMTSCDDGNRSDPSGMGINEIDRNLIRHIRPQNQARICEFSS